MYFHGAHIGGNFVCRDGRFVNVHGASLVGSAAEIGGSVYLTNAFVAIGEVYLRGITVHGSIHVHGGSFHDGLTEESSEREEDIRDTVDLEGARIDKMLCLTGVRRFKGSLDLQDAHVGIFADDSSVWNMNWNPA